MLHKFHNQRIVRCTPYLYIGVFCPIVFLNKSISMSFLAFVVKLKLNFEIIGKKMLYIGKSNEYIIIKIIESFSVSVLILFTTFTYIEFAKYE